MKLFIRYCLGNGSMVNLDVLSSKTIKDLKKIILNEVKHTNEDTDSVWLLHEDSLLDSDQATLEDYEIEDESTLEVITPNSRPCLMGTRFVDLSNEQGLKKCNWSKTAPKWRKTTRGLCLEGKCKTKGCEAFGHTVIIPIGYKRFDILNDADGQTSQCPICHKYVEPLTCGFNNCWWKYEGKKQSKEGDEPMKYTSDWRFANNAYHYFDQEATGLVIWRQLIIEAVKNKF